MQSDRTVVRGRIAKSTLRKIFIGNEDYVSKKARAPNDDLFIREINYQITFSSGNLLRLFFYRMADEFSQTKSFETWLDIDCHGTNGILLLDVFLGLVHVSDPITIKVEIFP
ncbi:uncharacterized protein LOC143264944 [Megachile rotundata]|uniref:uncharacterized protein LOC143264944 n=1 Tax=Megachile rotundata TaxID=143995 RepID=UPI003FD3B684